MDINSVYILTNFCANKTGRGYLTPDDFNNVLLFAETMFVAERLGLPEQYIAGKATGKEAYPLTKKIEDDLRPYLVPLNTTVPSNGIIPLPTDYLRNSSINSTYSWAKKEAIITLDCEDADGFTESTKTREVNVDVMINKAYTDRKYNSYKYPTKEFPICTFYDFGIEFAPADIGAIRFDYISVPKGAYWGFDNVNGEAIYNAAKSKQLQCPQDCYYKITSFVLRHLGLNLGTTEVQAFASQAFLNGV